MKIKIFILIFSCFCSLSLFSQSSALPEKKGLVDSYFKSFGTPCGGETFVNSSATASYTNGNFVGDNGVTWTYVNARNESTYPITSEGILLRDATSKITSSVVTGGIGDFSCKLLKGFTGSGNRQVELFINGISQGTSVAWDNTSVQTFTILNVDISGSVTIEIRNSTGRQVVIDDVSWTCYSGAAAPEIQLIDASVIDQNCGFSLDFGTQAIGADSDVTFNIENKGSLTLDISSFVTTGDFTVVSPTAPFSIASGGNELITMRFTPLTSGTRTGTLTINNNDENESACVVNLTGQGFIPAPEIDIERNTLASIPSGSIPSSGYNTLFAATLIGNTTAAKQFFIRNEGTDNLSITSITSSNSLEFVITSNLSPLNLAPGESTFFYVEFSPKMSGARTATITINNSDSDESSYTFGVSGTGNCGTYPISIVPSLGPAGTVVTVSGSNFGGATSATFNGVAATVNLISSTLVEVTIPIGVTSESLIVTNDLGCDSTQYFEVINSLIVGCEYSGGTLPSDLFISEITDKGVGSHSYIEIFNGTGSVVSLNNYEVRIHNNGAVTATSTIVLSGSINNNSVVVIGFGSGQASDPEGGYTADFINGAIGINNDDNIRLYKSGILIDLWGETSGSAFTITDENYTYRRKNTGITWPSVTWDSNDWIAFSPVNYLDIGYFDFSLGTPSTITTQPSFSNTNCSLTNTLTVQATESFVGGKVITYQWYFAAPGDTGWTPVPDNAIYDTPTSNILSILDSQTLEGYQYYCRVRENDDTCYKASNAVSLLISKTIWDGISWSNGVPDISTVSIINGDYDTSLNGSLSTCSLVVNASKNLSVANNTFVEVENNAIIDGTIVVETQGSFVQNNDVGTFTLNVGGSASVNKTTTPLNNWYEYTYWGSPIVDETVENALSIAPSSRRFYFKAENFVDLLEEINNSNTFLNNAGVDDIDDNGDDWQLATGVMIPGVGYAATGNSNGFVSGASLSTTFNGAYNNGIIQLPIVNNSSGLYNDWNFLGNPYPSALDASLFLALNTSVIDSAIYLWSHATPISTSIPGNYGYNFSNRDYATISGSGINTAGGDGIIPLNFVPSGQGFFVEAISTGTVEFNNSMRVTGNNNQFFKASKKGKYNLVSNTNAIWLNLTSNNGVFNQLAIAYIAGATNDYDGTFYDVKKNTSAGTAAIIYTSIRDNDEKFVIQGKDVDSLNFDEKISIGFYTSIEAPTMYKFSIAQLKGEFFTNNTVFLQDNVLDIVHDLSSEYEFTSEKGEFNERFEIVFKEKSLISNHLENDKNIVSIIDFSNGEVNFVVHDDLAIKNIEIIDVLGRTIYYLKGSTNSERYNLSKLNSAVYFAKVKLSNNQIIVKKSIKKESF